jgi:hypothetical protein
MAADCNHQDPRHKEPGTFDSRTISVPSRPMSVFTFTMLVARTCHAPVFYLYLQSNGCLLRRKFGVQITRPDPGTLIDSQQEPEQWVTTRKKIELEGGSVPRPPPDSIPSIGSSMT